MAAHSVQTMSVFRTTVEQIMAEIDAVEHPEIQRVLRAFAQQQIQALAEALLEAPPVLGKQASHDAYLGPIRSSAAAQGQERR
jgi:hypothetical protein